MPIFTWPNTGARLDTHSNTLSLNITGRLNHRCSLYATLLIKNCVCCLWWRAAPGEVRGKSASSHVPHYGPFPFTSGRRVTRGGRPGLALDPLNRRVFGECVCGGPTALLRRGKDTPGLVNYSLKALGLCRRRTRLAMSLMLI